MIIKFHVKTLDNRHECSELIDDEDLDVNEIHEYYNTTDWISHNKLEQFNGIHAIYGQVECFHQSDYKPGWLMNYHEDELLYRITLEKDM